MSILRPQIAAIEQTLFEAHSKMEQLLKQQKVLRDKIDASQNDLKTAKS